MNNNGCNDGLLGGLFGGRNNGNCHVTEKEFAWAQAYNTKQSEVDMLKSDQRTDGKLLELYREIDRRFTLTGNEIASIAANQAVTNQKLVDNIASIDQKIDCNVAAIYREIDCRTLPLEKKVPLTSVCPLPQPACPPVVDVNIVEIANQLARALKGTAK